MLINNWMRSGAKPTDLVRWIQSEYAKAKDDETRGHLGLMLCAALSAGNDDFCVLEARKCCLLFRCAHVPGMSPGEDALMQMAQDRGITDLEWLDTFNSYFAHQCRMPAAARPQTSVTKALNDCDLRNVVVLDSKNSVYLMKDTEGKLWLFAVNGCDTDMLIDEERFMREPPLYFTSDSHFVSPVYIVSETARILRHVLARIGYPPVPIRKAVVFEAPHANLINEDDYLSCKEWEGVEVAVLAKSNGRKSFPVSMPILPDGDGRSPQHMELCATLWLCVMATAEILASFDVAKQPEIPDSLIEECCSKAAVFSPTNHDFLFDGWDEDEED